MAYVVCKPDFHDLVIGVTYRRSYTNCQVYCKPCGEHFDQPDGMYRLTWRGHINVDGDILGAADIWPILICPSCGATIFVFYFLCEQAISAFTSASIPLQVNAHDNLPISPLRYPASG